MSISSSFIAKLIRENSSEVALANILDLVKSDQFLEPHVRKVLSDGCLLGRHEIILPFIDFIHSSKKNYCINKLIDIKNSEMRNLVHLAAWSGSGAIVKRLASIGVDINAQDKFGITPIMLAAHHGFGGGFSLDALIQIGSDLTLKDSNGSDILVYARHLDHKSMSFILQKQLAQIEKRKLGMLVDNNFKKLSESEPRRI